MRRRYTKPISTGPRSMTARFRGKCSGCGGVIEQGVGMIWIAKGQAYHTSCYKPEEHKAPEQPSTRTVPNDKPFKAGVFGPYFPNSEPVKETTFRTSQELLDFVGKTDESYHSHKERNSSFCAQSWNETIGACKSGFSEGVKQIDEIATAISTRLVTDKGHSIDMDVTGDYIDIGAYVSGVPECWGLITETETRQKEEVRIVASITHVWNTPPDRIINRGAAITALVDELRKTHNVNLSFELKFERGPDMDFNHYYLIEVDMDADYSRDLVAFYAAHPGMLRRLMFAVEELNENKKDCGGYGKPKVDDVQAAPKGVIYFPPTRESTSYPFATLESSVAYVKKILESTVAAC